MDIYLVGGAVRDELLGQDVHERDWVVVGSTPEEMLENGYTPVGKDFPVFLHPHTHEEYALARTERKSGYGYKGFTIYADPSTTLEDDLIRRDLTINAIAQCPNGTLIDPFNGLADINNKLLRHISPAFAEDPLRVLRVARFHARYCHLGFTIAPDTEKLMHSMVSSGELEHLVAERVFQELLKILSASSPAAGIRALKNCGALRIILPEVDQLFGVPQPAKHHPEIDTWDHTLMALEQSVVLNASLDVRFSVLVHDVGKALTPKNHWPHHYQHETRGIKLVEDLCHRLKAPNQFRVLAKMVCQYHTLCHQALELKPSTIAKSLKTLNAYRNDVLFEKFLIACEADAKGRKNLEKRPYPQATFLRKALEVTRNIDTQSIIKEGDTGEQIGHAIHQQRVSILKRWIKTQAINHCD